MPHNKLWLLIKSLTKGEKKSVVSAVKYKKEGKSNTIRLFEAIEKQQEYDESALKKMFAGSKMVKHFAAEKVHLYDFILKNLADYHQNLSPKTLGFDLLKRAEILYNKGFYAACRQLLKKVEKIAHDYSLLTVAYEAVNMKIMLAGLRINQDSKTEMQYLIENRSYIIKQMNNVSNYQLISSEIYSIYRELYANTSEDSEKALEHLMSHPLLQNESEAIAYEARKSFYYIHFLYNAITQQHDASHIFLKKRIEWVETKPYILKREMPSYMRDLVNLARLQIQLKDINSSKVTLVKLKELPKKYSPSFNTTSKRLLTTKSLLIESMVCMATLDFQAAESIALQVKTEILAKQSKHDVVDVFNIYCHLANIEFYLQHYDQTIDWCNRIQQLPNTDNLVVELIAIQIFNLLSHYELGNYDLLEYLVKQAVRYMDKKGKSNPFIRTLLFFIKSDLSNPNVSQENFQKCKNKLLEIQSNTTTNMLPNFDIITWLDSKIQGKSFLECAKEKIIDVEIT